MKRVIGGIIVLALAILAAWRSAGPSEQSAETAKTSLETRMGAATMLPLITSESERPPLTPKGTNEHAPADVSQLILNLGRASDSPGADELQRELANLASRRTARLIIEAGLQATTEDQVNRLAGALAKMTVDEALPEVVGLLENPTLGTMHPLAKAARQVLARTGTPYAVSVLAKSLQAAAPEDQALYAVALSSVAADQAIDELIILAEGRRPELAVPMVRTAAIRALRQYPLSLTGPTLDRLVADPEPTISETAKTVAAMMRR